MEYQAFHKDFWKFMKAHKNIPFENGVIPEVYWETLIKDGRELAEQKYPTKYAQKSVISFIEKISAQAKEMKEKHQALAQIEQSFEKDSPEWLFYRDFFNLSKKYTDPPALFPDKTNEAEIETFWNDVYNETKTLSLSYGDFERTLLTNFLCELEEKAKKKAAELEYEQLQFPDIGYEELNFG